VAELDWVHLKIMTIWSGMARLQDGWVGGLCNLQLVTTRNTGGLR